MWKLKYKKLSENQDIRSYLKTKILEAHRMKDIQEIFYPLCISILCKYWRGSFWGFFVWGGGLRWKKYIMFQKSIFPNLATKTRIKIKYWKDVENKEKLNIENIYK